MKIKNAVLVVALAVLYSPVFAVNLYESGYSYRSFAPTEMGDSLAIDSTGNLYSPSTNGVMRYAPDGTGTLWSNAKGYGISVAPDGTAFMAKRGAEGSGPNILRIEADGTFSTLAGSTPIGSTFTWTAVAPDNSLYANVWAGHNPGIYRMDPNSGEYSFITSAADFYGSMAFGPDGYLYTIGSQSTGASVMRLVGNDLVPYVNLPVFGFGLAFTADGDFFFSSPGGSNFIFRYDASTQSVNSFADGMGLPCGLAYDTVRDTLYVREQGGAIYAFDKGPYDFRNASLPVPEPETYAMMLAGLGLLGVMTRRRKQKLACQ